jgi:hypothetical protein
VDAGKLSVLPPLCILYVDVSAFKIRDKLFLIFKQTALVNAGKLSVLPPLCILYVDVSAFKIHDKLFLIFKQTALKNAGKHRVNPPLCILYVDVSAYFKNIREISFNRCLLANPVYFLPSASSMLMSAPKKNKSTKLVFL